MTIENLHALNLSIWIIILWQWWEAIKIQVESLHTVDAFHAFIVSCFIAYNFVFIV